MDFTAIQGIFSEQFWYIAPILVTMTTFLSGLINQGLSKVCTVPGWAKQLVSWGMGAGLSCAAWGLKVIEFGDPVWVGVVALCAVVGLSSNGIYDIDFIHKWIDSWFVNKLVFMEAKPEEHEDESLEDHPLEERPEEEQLDEDTNEEVKEETIKKTTRKKATKKVSE